MAAEALREHRLSTGFWLQRAEAYDASAKDQQEVIRKAEVALAKAQSMPAFAFLGFACARRHRGAFHATLLASIVLVPIAVLAFAPEIESYRGLSGLASAMFALLLTLERRRLTWPVVLCAIAFAGKIAFEAVTGGTLFVGAMGERVVSVPIAHIAGALAGAISGLAGGRPYTPRPCASLSPCSSR